MNFEMEYLDETKVSAKEVNLFIRIVMVSVVFRLLSSLYTGCYGWIVGMFLLFCVWNKFIFLPTNSVVMAVLLLVMAVLLLFLSLLSVVMTVLLLVMAVLLQYCLSVFCQWLWLCNNFLAAPPQTSLPQPVQQVGYSTQTFKPIYR